MTLHPEERDPEPPFDQRALFALLERPDIAARMEAVRVSVPDLGFSEAPQRRVPRRAVGDHPR